MMDDFEPSISYRLISAVKRNDCLYDTTNIHYRNQRYKIKAWRQLVDQLHFIGDHAALAARWKQLRDKYGKERRKAENTETPSKWQYFTHMSFLDPFMVDRRIYGSPERESQKLTINTDSHFVISLISHVHSHPCLYDVTNHMYRNANTRSKAWQTIIQLTNFPGGEQVIYKQWKKYRDHYVRERRRINERRADGVIEESSWEFYDNLQWLDGYLDERNQSIKRKHESEPETEDTDFDPVFEAHPLVGGDVMLDGDHAFAASVVSDLKALSEDHRIYAMEEIRKLLEAYSAE